MMLQQHHCLLQASQGGQLTWTKFRPNFNTLFHNNHKFRRNFTLSVGAIQKPNLHRLGSETTLDLESTAEEEELYSAINPPIRDNVVTAEDWRKALSKVVPAVVVLRITAPRAFDTEPATSGYATGFVVDKLRGIILTNRHVVMPGPVVAEAMFVNCEEVSVHPIYRDPVHDFGFFRYNPDELKFLNYEEIPLAPVAASVGLEVRVVGNDSGEKVSILAGTLARLDRDAPQYEKDGYNDFNTFYIQAANGTKGGSSGSPAIDWLGRAVALNAGGKSSSASAYLLPLERVVRALKFLQNGRDSYVSKWKAVAIPRGTLQVTFLHKGFDEVRRLGLQSETEQIARNASKLEETGMLVVDSVVPGGPAHNQLETGDVLVRVNGEVITRFLNLESLLDDSVHQKIELHIERGGVQLTVSLLVQDLHVITPDYFLEVSGAIIHPLSYQQARNFRFRCGLAYVAEPGYMLSRAGVPRHAIIKKFAGEKISKLDDVISVLSKLSKGSRAPLEYVSYKDRYQPKSVLVAVDDHEWHAPPKIYTRDDSSGLWTAKPAYKFKSSMLSSVIDGKVIHMEHTHQCIINQELADEVARMGTSSEKDSAESDIGSEKRRVEADLAAHGIVADSCLHENPVEKPAIPNPMQNAIFRDYEGATAAAANASVAEHVIEPTLVMLEVHVPSSCMLDGVHSQHSSGTGVIIYHSQNLGLVIADRYIAGISASDVKLSFAAFPAEIPGEVVFLHPIHNYALVAYDPGALGPVGVSMVRAAELFPEPSLRRGDSVYLVGLNKSLQAASRKSIVTNPYGALNIGSAYNPKYRATNMEVVEIDADFGSTFSGVLTDEYGRVQAIWAKFWAKPESGSNTSEDDYIVRGIPVYTLSNVLDKIISGAKGTPFLINGIQRPMPLVRILEVELYPAPLSKARSFGLSDDWIQALVKKDPIRRQVLGVKGCVAGSKTKNLLEHGDMILAVNKKPVTCFQDIEDACEELDCGDNDGNLNITIYRNGREMNIRVGTDVRDGNGTSRAVHWCGCIVQKPHLAVRALGFLPEEGHGVYVAWWYDGSPADRYGLLMREWIVEVDGKPTPDLDAFINVTKELEHGVFVRVRTIGLNGKPRVLAVKQDLHYWPTWELRFDLETAIWRRTVIKALDCSLI